MDKSITQQLITRQVKALGYQDGETIAIRLIAGKGFEVKQDGLYPFSANLTVGSWELTRLKSKKHNRAVDSVHKDGIGYLLRENMRGYGVYLVPNKGGHEDGDISEVTALFYECDDIDKDEQLQRIKRLDVDPSLVIETRNSLHVYYGLADGDRIVEGWRKRQQRLIQLMESDRSIHNESRLMRLAGFFHQKKGYDPLLIDIVDGNDNRYQLKQFDNLLPKWDESKWADVKTHDVDWENQVKAFKSKRKVIQPSDDAFPLEICLPKADRDLIQCGVGKGEGYVKGFKLACNLLATESFLSSAGYRFTGNAQDLFCQFAYNSPESYHGQKDVDLVLSNARRKNPTPTLTINAIENCVNAWRRKNGKVEWIDGIVEKVKTTAKDGMKSMHAFIDKMVGGAGGFKRKLQKMLTGLIPTKVDLFYKAGDGAKTYEQAARSGKKYILDKTQPGLGKTFAVSQLDKNAMFLIPDGEDEILTRLFYCPPSYRNPTNAKIEEDWYETPARNNGYFINYGKHTELGNPYRESLKGLGEIDDHERTQSNCHKADEFHQHYAAGRSTEGLCKACNLRDKCAVKKGEGYGYISDVKKWIAEGKIRTSAQWLDKDKTSICQTGIIFDEAGQVAWLRTITVKVEYLYRLMDKIRRADKELHKRLIDIQYAISDLVDSEDYPKYGYDTKALFDSLKLDKELTADLEKVLEIELDGRKPEENEENEIDPIFLYDLIRLMLGQTKGSVNLTRNNLTISVTNDLLRQAVHAAKFVICQDATWSASHMAMALGVKESDIYVVCQEQVIPTNLVIEHWKGIGNLGNNRSEKTKELVRVIRNQLVEKIPVGLGVIEWKAHAHASDLIHCGDSRGSNAYKEKTVVASIGLSRPNMTAIRLEYETLSGHIIEGFDDESFKAYYGHAVAANLIQEIGRLRANRRPNEDLKFILIGDGDIQFLEDLGFDVVECDASTKLDGLDVGQAGARARYLNMGMRLCRLLGEKAWRELTLKRAAEHLERAASSVSRFVRRWFGVEGDNQGIAFKRFKEMVYAAIYGEPSDGFTEEEEINIEAIGMMLQKVKYCGAELGQELKNLIEICTWDVFIESVKRLDNDYGIKLIASIFNVALQT